MAARIILAALVIAQLADASTFVVGESIHGIGLESNAFAVAVHEVAGLPGVMALKGGALVTVIGVITVTAHRFPRLLWWAGAAGAAMGLLGFLANLTSLLILAG